ncbi:MAG TPA: hypothetical protein PKA49_13485 [Tepidiformaceae bacterium]|nr:hypothetical protein [Tepidiformaceae bacterium]
MTSTSRRTFSDPSAGTDRPQTDYFPRVLDTVFAIDGKRIGTVVAVLRDSFRIDRNGTAVTATFDCLFNREPGRVNLLCDESGLSRYLRR